jgi:hypothetical protein
MRRPCVAGTVTKIWTKPPRPPAHGSEPLRAHFVGVAELKEAKKEDVMGRGLLLWLLGIPLPIIILIWVLGGLHG